MFQTTPSHHPLHSGCEVTVPCKYHADDSGHVWRSYGRSRSSTSSGGLVPSWPCRPASSGRLQCRCRWHAGAPINGTQCTNLGAEAAIPMALSTATQVCSHDELPLRTLVSSKSPNPLSIRRGALGRATGRKLICAVSGTETRCST